jgi:hypothetical protein
MVRARAEVVRSRSVCATPPEMPGASGWLGCYDGRDRVEGLRTAFESRALNRHSTKSVGPNRPVVREFVRRKPLLTGLLSFATESAGSVSNLCDGIPLPVRRTTGRKIDGLEVRRTKTVRSPNDIFNGTVRVGSLEESRPFCLTWFDIEFGLFIRPAGTFSPTAAFPRRDNVECGGEGLV